MAIVNYIGSLSDSEILALTSSSPLWIETAFYYPNDYPRLSYFYRLLDGEMYQIGKEDEQTAIGGVGVMINNNVIGGVKRVIEENETLTIPEHYEYNVHSLDNYGTINNSGQIILL